MGGGWLFGRAFYRIYKGEPIFAKKLCTAAENGIYKAMGVDPREEMSVKRYALGILFLSGISLIFFMAVVMLQAFLAMNPEKIDGMSWHLAFNTAVSFVTNTNWQAYSGETGLILFLPDDLSDDSKISCRARWASPFSLLSSEALRADSAKP